MSNAGSVQKGALHALPSIADSFIRQKILLRDYVPFSAATLWRLVSAGKFPKPIRLANQIIAWRASDVREWSKNPEAYSANCRG
jgi:predicted DNA-binding transcriptional regulator AlpA